MQNETSLLSYVLDKVEDGANFHVHYPTRTLKVNGKTLIKDGVNQTDHPLDIECADNIQSVITELERLYDRYQHSAPSEKSESHYRLYFSALPEERLDIEDMLYGESREHARCALELYLLLCLINEAFTWQTEWAKHYFWQSKKHKSFVILKEWVSPTTSIN